MNFEIKIEDYKGPIDVLLELFKKNELEITKININIILEQYLEFISILQKENYDIAFEYLDLMAEIILYKSQKLLHQEIEEEEVEELINEEYFLEKILEYKTYQEASIKINNLQQNRGQYLTKNNNDINNYRKDELKKISKYEFENVIEESFLKYLEKTQKEEIKYISKTDYNIEEYLNKIKSKDKIILSEEFTGKNKKEIIIIFLALLEILKNENYMLLPGSNDIFIKKG